MSFVVQRVTDRGLVLHQLGGTVLRIGRGTSAEVRSENPAVALEHASIEEDASGFTITDQGSITGTYVNRKPVEAIRLAKGDVIEIGDLHIEVQLAEPERPLFLRVSSTATAARGRGEGVADDDGGARSVPAGGAVRAPRIDYVSAYRLRRTWFTKLSLAALVAIAALTIVTQLMLPGAQTAFMPGGLSSAHARAQGPDGRPIANDCHACHDPWRGVNDASCSSCHARAPHASTEAQTPPCITCHAEHRGMAKLAAGADSRCASCHRDLASHVRAGVVLRPAVAHVAAFGDEGHPDFTFPSDGDTLRFNHRLHLQPGGIFNGGGKREVLACTNCHALLEARGKADPKPLRFANDCQRCHKLTFDPRYATAEVPHGGDPGLVYGFILATYAGRRDVTGKSPDELRRILTARTEATPDERAVLNAEQVIKTKCTLCHELRRVNGQLAATPPAIRARWLQHAKFTHGTHRNVDCETCHDSARKSAATSDVLMPSRNDCVGCHGAAGPRAATTCVTCHEYHESSRTLRTQMAAGFLRGTRERAVSSGGRAGMLGTVLLCAIVLLLIVVLVPLGLALYQRLRFRPEPPRADVPTTPSILPPTTRIPALNLPAPAPQQQLPPPAPTPPEQEVTPGKTIALDRTRVDQKTNDPSPGGTEALQWYGMISCTSGPLEGQRWVVEEEGLYIGRDASMSQIVIPDGRVSKRHVRIVPRDGRAHAIDQGSTNGTFLGKADGQRITDVQLKRGDVLVIADNVATFLYQI